MPPSPTSIRRRVRVLHRTGDEVTFVTKSFSLDDGTKYHPVINAATGTFSCDCPDHLYRGSFCKHLRRAQAGLKRSSVSPIPSLPPPPDSDSDSVSTSPTPPVASPPVASPPPAASSAVSHPSSPVAMLRFFTNEQIVQIIPAPPSLRAQFSDGYGDVPVLCLALLCVPDEKSGRSKDSFQLVMPMVAYQGAVELACDIDRPYLRLSTESR